jgi:hypothetical protein
MREKLAKRERVYPGFEAFKQEFFENEWKVETFSLNIGDPVKPTFFYVLYDKTGNRDSRRVYVGKTYNQHYEIRVKQHFVSKAKTDKHWFGREKQCGWQMLGLCYGTIGQEEDRLIWLIKELFHSEIENKKQDKTFDPANPKKVKHYELGVEDVVQSVRETQ